MNVARTHGVSKKIIDGKTSFRSLGDNGDKIVLATLTSNLTDSNKQDWVISHISNGGLSRLKAQIPIEKNGTTTSSSTSGADIINGKSGHVSTASQSRCIRL